MFPVIAVDDDDVAPCQGSWNLDVLFTEVYWKENSTWYKIPDNKMSSIYPWVCKDHGGCPGGQLPWGDPFTCYISGNAYYKVTVNASQVPCVNDYPYVQSCWVWRNIKLGSSIDIYRVVIPNVNHNTIEPWLNYYSLPNYSMYAREESVNDAIWSSNNSGPPYYISIYSSESRWDLRNGNDNWVKTDPGWGVTTRVKKLEKRYRLFFNGSYIYLWMSTSNMTAFKNFEIHLQKGTSPTDSMHFSKNYESYNDNQNDFIRNIDYDMAQRIKHNSINEILNEILMSSSFEEDFSTSIRIDNFSEGYIAGLHIEKIDKNLMDKQNSIFEGATILSINGYKLSEFELIENVFEYLEKNKILSIVLLDRNMMLYEMVEE